MPILLDPIHRASPCLQNDVSNTNLNDIVQKIDHIINIL
jgi:hypothetical protein